MLILPNKSIISAASRKKGGGGGGGDPYWANVELLLAMDGANNSTVFTDSSSNNRTITTVGTAKLSTANPKWGASSGYFDGGGELTGSTANALGSTYTIEFWFYKTIDAGQVFYSQSGGFSDDGINIRYDLQISSGFPGVIFNGTTVPSNTWNHIAFCKSGNTAYRGLNGVVDSASFTSNHTNVNFTIGDAPGSPYAGNMYGYLDDFRITRGVARYTSNYTVPTAAFPTS